MANVTPTPTNNVPDHLSGWDELRRAADQLELEIHLGTLEARDRWRDLKPQLAALEKKIAKVGKEAGQAIAKEIDALRKTIVGLRSGIDHPDA